METYLFAQSGRVIKLHNMYHSKKLWIHWTLLEMSRKERGKYLNSIYTSRSAYVMSKKPNTQRLNLEQHLKKTQQLSNKHIVVWSLGSSFCLEIKQKF